MIEVARLVDGRSGPLLHCLCWRRGEYHLVGSVGLSADLVVYIEDDEEIIAWLGVVESSDGGGIYYGAGTWVKESYRGRGLATDLWKRLLEELPDATFEVTVQSEGGRALMQAIGDPRILVTDGV